MRHDIHGRAGVIMMTTQLLSLILRKMRQPRVISEVIGGIFLGMLRLYLACDHILITAYWQARRSLGEYLVRTIIITPSSKHINSTYTSFGIKASRITSSHLTPFPTCHW